ncbi:cysteine hydrolase family protein [Paenibacillus medicaginis]|uniref:Cysteine hydrolase family protein n=1 Tax=Paenibacillus medicaginis TaxID=1470560 RepID=A0ABV5C3M3_9BACL
MKTALLVIDVQNVMFLPQYNLYRGDEVLDTIDRLIQKARETGTEVIYIQHTEQGDPEFSMGEPTWEIHDKIKPLPTDTVIQKSVCDSFYKTGLQAALLERGVEKLVIAGMQTEFCVDTTVRCAFSKGYKVTLVQDAHSTFDNGIIQAEQIIRHHNKVLSPSFATLKPAEEIEF